MNTLSWMLYLADTAGSLRALTAVVGFVALAGALFTGVASLVGWEAYTYDSPTERDEKQRQRRIVRKASVRCASVAVALGAVSAFVPRTSTIYLIAASEAGEAVVTSEDGSKMLSDLRRIIERRIDEELERKR